MLRGDVSRGGRMLAFVLVFLVGAGAALLVAGGNPGNMGICGACFLRDLAGSLGLFVGRGPRIFRPELAGLMLGPLAFVLLRGRFEARSGSHAATRFFFGLLMGVGTLVFLGCPFRMLQRIGGGDLNAWLGALGLVAGVGVGLAFEKRGYNLGRTSVVSRPVGLLGPLSLTILFLLFLRGGVLFGPGPGADAPPAHAPWALSFMVALGAGAVLSATRFCVITAARQVYGGERRMLAAALILVVGYGLVAASAGNFRLAFEGQPIAHSEGFWNVAALFLVGLCGCLVGGCPVRQIVMAGEGNGDAFVTVAGLVVGGGLSHSLKLASSGMGTTPGGRMVVAAGIAVAVAYAFWISRSAGNR